ncbi:ATP synthase subunit I [Neisseria sp.]|uniref:ATP synthase subunit I n=1 Tax=Neisseria sp. TaxID=192066 RepID=UPI0035A17977
MKRIVFMQVSALAVAAGVCGLVSGFDGLLSALAGGLCYLIPFCCAVLLSKLSGTRSAYTQGRVFLAGEVLKVVLSLLLMLAVFVLWHEQIVFLPFLAGLLSVSHLVFLAFLRVRNYGR